MRALVTDSIKESFGTSVLLTPAYELDLHPNVVIRVIHLHLLLRL
jgi:hypothetical protein